MVGYGGGKAVSFLYPFAFILLRETRARLFAFFPLSAFDHSSLL